MPQHQQQRTAGDAIATEQGNIEHAQRAVEREQKYVRHDLAGDGRPRRVAQPIAEAAVTHFTAQAGRDRQGQPQRQDRREQQRQKELLIAARWVVQDLRLHGDRWRAQLRRADLLGESLTQQARIPRVDRFDDIAHRRLAGGEVGGVVVGEHRALFSTQRLPGGITRHQYHGEHLQPSQLRLCIGQAGGLAGDAHTGAGIEHPRQLAAFSTVVEVDDCDGDIAHHRGRKQPRHQPQHHGRHQRDQQQIGAVVPQVLQFALERSPCARPHRLAHSCGHPNSTLMPGRKPSIRATGRSRISKLRTSYPEDCRVARQVA
ncbi:hypothetical protein D3C81_1118900 [compost metagenome]